MAAHASTQPDARVLLTGATGYVGGRLLPELERRTFRVGCLERRGLRVRCVARRPENLTGRVAPQTEVVAGDLLRPETLPAVLAGVRTAVYLVHAMGSPGSFVEQDRRAAASFARAARDAGVERIVYLGGLGDHGAALSDHLRSRHEVGDVLRGSGVQVIELRASIVIGSGSLSFEMIRALVERLPVMVTPRWVSMPAQPIAIADLLDYLVAAIEMRAEGHRIYEIGGADRVSYGDLLREYARQRGLRRVMLRVPVLTPRLSSLWLGLVTPVYARIGRKLVDSICHATVVHDDAARRDFAVRPRGHREAIADALRCEDREIAATRWSDALSSSGAVRPEHAARFGRRLVDSRVARVPVPPAAAFAPIRTLGGTRGWPYGQWLWRLRGWLDLLVGGVGMRRGRRDPELARVGDTIDCWRVEAFAPDRLLRLAAEMRLPGRAWLEFEVEGDEHGSTIRQTALFDPIGLGGLAYWYLVYPLHQLVFAGMLRALAAQAIEASRTPAELHAAHVHR